MSMKRFFQEGNMQQSFLTGNSMPGMEQLKECGLVCPQDAFRPYH